VGIKNPFQKDAIGLSAAVCRQTDARARGIGLPTILLSADRWHPTYHERVIEGILCVIVCAMAAGMCRSTAAQAGEAMTEDQIRECYRKSYSAERILDYDGSMKALEPLKDIVAQHYMYSLRLGWLQYLRGAYPEAKAQYQAAIKVAPNSIEAKLGFVLVTLALGRWDEAESICKKILETDANNYYASLRLAFALRMQTKLDQAERIVASMLALYPTDLSFRLEAAYLKVARNQTIEARQAFKDVLLVDPDNALAKEQLAKL